MSRMERDARRAEQQVKDAEKEADDLKAEKRKMQREVFKLCFFAQFLFWQFQLSCLVNEIFQNDAASYKKNQKYFW